MTQKDFAPIHPGEILLEDFLKPKDITPGRLAALISVDRRRTSEIIAGKRDISADTALRLARLFGTTPAFWLNLQNRYDIDVAEDDHGDQILESVQPLSSADAGVSPPL